MITFERLQSQLLLRLDSLFPHLLHLTSEHHLWLGSAVDTVGLDTDNDAALGFEEQVRVQADDSRLVGLGNVREDHVNHGDEHAVAEGVSGVLDNGDHVRAVGGHADQVTAGTVGELNCVDVSGRSDDVSDVTDGGTAGSTEVQDLGARPDVDVVQTTQNTSRELATEGVPHAVFDLGDSAVLLSRGLGRDTLLAVDSLTWCQVASNEQVLLTTTREEDTGVTVGFLVDQLMLEWIQMARTGHQ